MSRGLRNPGNRGFTLVELMIAASLLAVMGYGLSLAFNTGRGSQHEVMHSVETAREVREAHALLREDLRQSSDDQLTVTVLGTGNHQLDLRHPIDDGGTPGWGVFDESLGATPAEQNRPDWTIRYTVDVVVNAGVANRRLVRRVLDDTNAVQSEEILVTGLRSGAAEPPGFTVDPAGDLWEVTLSTEGTRTTDRGPGTSFHVQTRN